jgi:hypothetical protein
MASKCRLFYWIRILNRPDVAEFDTGAVRSITNNHAE